jgi:hypothetical protein
MQYSSSKTLTLILLAKYITSQLHRKNRNTLTSLSKKKKRMYNHHSDREARKTHTQVSSSLLSHLWTPLQKGSFVSIVCAPFRPSIMTLIFFRKYIKTKASPRPIFKQIFIYMV